MLCHSSVSAKIDSNLLYISVDFLSTTCHVMKQIGYTRSACGPYAHTLTHAPHQCEQHFCVEKHRSFRCWVPGCRLTRCHQLSSTHFLPWDWPEILYLAQLKRIASVFLPSEGGHTGILQKGNRCRSVMSRSQIWLEVILPLSRGKQTSLSRANVLLRGFLCFTCLNTTG